MARDVVRPDRASRSITTCALVATAALAAGCPHKSSGKGPGPGAPPVIRPRLLTALHQLNVGSCDGRRYVQEELQEPTRITAVGGQLSTELVVAIRERCVPVWDATSKAWTMQTLKLRTYGFPADPSHTVTEAEADDPASPAIAWSAPGPTFVVEPASKPGADDGTRLRIRLFNRMPYDANDQPARSTSSATRRGPTPASIRRPASARSRCRRRPARRCPRRRARPSTAR